MHHPLRALLLLLFTGPCALAAVFQGNGFKIGEVTSDTAVIWTRLTTRPEANWSGTPFIAPQIERAVQTGEFDWRIQIPAGKGLADMQGALPGAPGAVRVVLRPAGGGSPVEAKWISVEVAHDCTRQFTFDRLQPHTRYDVTVECRDPAGAAGPTLTGSFVTAPAAGRAQPARFVVVTCGDYPRRDDPQNGHRIYASMLKLSPDFLVHTGDVEYFDKADPIANSPELARFKFNRLFALPFQRAFHQRVPAYFLCDDHDILKNDCWPGQTFGSLTFEEGSRIFREQTPAPSGGRLYRTIRWGRDVQFWLMEGRQYRSSNKLPDGPDKTIWGREQKEWLFRTVAASDATFKILMSATPIVGPDRGNKGDNHANTAFQAEGDEIRKFIGSRKDMIVMNGDRHWQYMSVHPTTGVREFGCGPMSDVHAGGYKPVPGDEVTQKFFRLKGGFLSAEVRRDRDTPRMIVRHHDVDGGVVQEYTLESAQR